MNKNIAHVSLQVRSWLERKKSKPSQQIYRFNVEVWCKFPQMMQTSPLLSALGRNHCMKQGHDVHLDIETPFQGKKCVGHSEIGLWTRN